MQKNTLLVAKVINNLFLFFFDPFFVAEMLDLEC